MSEIGARIERVDDHTVKINGSSVKDVPLDLLGLLLGKHKWAEVILPGGCNIGSRPIELHIKGFCVLGANVEIRNGAGGL